MQKRAAGGERKVSSYVATALEDYQERENLDDILAAWRAETRYPTRCSDRSPPSWIRLG
jgi:hypothetical protein